VNSTSGRGRRLFGDAICEWGRQLVENPPWNAIPHVCANMRFVSDGPDVAEGSTILITFMTRMER
jgi:hypothetical protein